MKLSLFFLSGIVALGMVSCSQLIDFKPPLNTPNEEALNTTDNLETAINGCYNSFQSTSFYGAAVRMVPDVMSDHIRSNRDALNNGQTNGFYDTYRRLLFAQGDGIWATGYQAINRANNIINAIQTGKVEVKDSLYLGNRDRLLGEAFFIRACAHFELVRLFGYQHGTPEADQDQSGVLIRTSPTTDRLNQPRATTTQVYQQVVADLKQAAQRLKASESFTKFFPVTYQGRVGGRATEMAALGMLAKVYFFMGTTAGNDLAEALTDSLIPVLQTQGFVLDALPAGATASDRDNSPYIKQGFSAARETIFQIVNTADPVNRLFNTTSATIINSYTQFAEGQTFRPFFLTSQKFISDANFNNPSVTNVDRRFRLFTNSGPVGVNGINQNDNRVIQKYWFREDRRIPGVGVLNLAVLRLAELYLIQAEVKAYKGLDAAAQTAINTVRRRAGLPDLASTITGPNLVNEVRFERIRELAWEGDRLHNLRRINALFLNGGYSGIPVSRIMGKGRINPATGNQNEDGGDRQVLDVDVLSNAVQFPIPDAELFSNPAIKR